MLKIKDIQIIICEDTPGKLTNTKCDLFFSKRKNGKHKETVNNVNEITSIKTDGTTVFSRLSMDTRKSRITEIQFRVPKTVEVSDNKTLIGMKTLFIEEA